MNCFVASAAAFLYRGTMTTPLCNKARYQGSHHTSLHTNRGEIQTMSHMEPVDESGLSEVGKFMTDLFVQRQSYTICFKIKFNIQILTLCQEGQH